MPDSDQRLVVYAAEPGTPTYAAFQQLRAHVRERDHTSDLSDTHGAAAT